MNILNAWNDFHCVIWMIIGSEKNEFNFLQ